MRTGFACAGTEAVGQVCDYCRERSKFPEFVSEWHSRDCTGTPHSNASGNLLMFWVR